MNIKKLSLLVILVCFVNFTHAAKNLSSGIKELIPDPCSIHTVRKLTKGSGRKNNWHLFLRTLVSALSWIHSQISQIQRFKQKDFEVVFVSWDKDQKHN